MTDSRLLTSELIVDFMSHTMPEPAEWILVWRPTHNSVGQAISHLDRQTAMDLLRMALHRLDTLAPADVYVVKPREPH
jgi:hypothetical protein